MDYFAQQLINGLVLGSIYGLIAIGYTMVYGIVGMINFAHGDIFMIGGFIALITFLILVSFGLTTVPLILLVVLLVAMAVTALYGWTVERIAYRPLRHSFRLAPMLSAIGMSFVLINYSQVAQGARVKPVPPIITGGHTLHEGPEGFVVQLSNIQIIVVITTIVLLALFTWLVSRTRLGRDMRACEQDQTMAALRGVDVDRTISMTFVIGAALAAVAGMMYLLYYGVVDFYMGFVAGIKAFTAAVLGGIVALVLFSLMIGIRTEAGPTGQLIFWTRFGDLAIMVVIVFAGSILTELFRQWLSARHHAPILPENAKRGLSAIGRLVVPVLLVFAFLVPVIFYNQRYILDLGILVLTYVMLGWGLNIVVGLAGLLDLGYVAFYAVGAYSYALLSTTFGLSFWVCLPLAGILAAFWGMLLGFPVLRLRGDYLAIVTLAFGEIIRLVLLNWQHVTGGPNGISGIPRPSLFGIPLPPGPNGLAAHLGIPFSPTHRLVLLFYIILAQ